MFSKLDTSGDLFLDQTELAAINLDKYEVCIRPFFNSCDTYKDGRVSTAEWCFCFWRESEYLPGAPWHPLTPCGAQRWGGIPHPASLWESQCLPLAHRLRLRASPAHLFAVSIRASLTH
jgi:hypothetical protein